jgi:ABC-2 type transport system ATP-binding protein
VITVSHLTFEYPGVRALDDVSFSLERGSITALVGPNGAGKTTLMRCLCGLERPLAGGVVVDGIDVIEEPRRSHEKLGYLSDFFGLYADLTVAQCLHYAVAANHVPGDPAPFVAATAARLNLADRLDQPAGTLSRGLRQRLAIGQAIIHQPRVLILDEPASGLDPEARHALAILFRQLQADGMTLLVSSHILAELEEYATDMLIIREGRLIEFRHLQGGRPDQRRLVLTLLGDAGPVAGMLGTRPGVSELESRDRKITFALEGGDEAQQALLAELIGQGARVLSFGEAAPDLQASYLQSMQHAAAPRA